MRMSVTVVIPTIPIRRDYLNRALVSVMNQTVPVESVAIAMDHKKSGAWATRQKALDMVKTEWVAFLDDDDEFLPHHIQRCLQAQAESGADVIVPWYEVVGGTDPVPLHRGLQVDPLHMHSFGITCLVRTQTIRDIGAFFHPREQVGLPEDFHFWIQMGQGGARFFSIPDTTWKWHHHGANTSGMPERWEQ